MNFNDIKINLQYFLPKHILTRAVGLLASSRLGKTTTYAIEHFAKFYNINLDEMEGRISDYQTFNDFFARPLKYNARPIDSDKSSIIFPSDGKISQYGYLHDTFQLQAKNHYFTCEALLGDEKDAQYFKDGNFITVYLSPRDYHRVHMPFDGKLLKMTHIPGELFSVNPLYVRNIPELYARNERVVCLFETSIGKMAVIMVGAAIVRSISMDWAGVVAPSKSGGIHTEIYKDTDLRYNKGEEIGKFFMGSTVICLFEKNKIEFTKLNNEQEVQIGCKMAQCISAGSEHKISKKSTSSGKKSTGKKSVK